MKKAGFFRDFFNDKYCQELIKQGGAKLSKRTKISFGVGGILSILLVLSPLLFQMVDIQIDVFMYIVFCAIGLIIIFLMDEKYIDRKNYEKNKLLRMQAVQNTFDAIWPHSSIEEHILHIEAFQSFYQETIYMKIQKIFIHGSYGVIVLTLSISQFIMGFLPFGNNVLKAYSVTAVVILVLKFVIISFAKDSLYDFVIKDYKTSLLRQYAMREIEMFCHH